MISSYDLELSPKLMIKGVFELRLKRRHCAVPFGKAVHPV